MQVSGERIFIAEGKPIQSYVCIDWAYLKADVLEQCEQKKFKKRWGHRSPRDQIAMGFINHCQDFISTRVKATGGFVQSCFISALPFVSLVALLKMDCRKTKVETGEHLGNYRSNLGGKLWRGSEWRWWEMFRCWICLWDGADRISDGSDVACERGKSQGYLQSCWAE